MILQCSLQVNRTELAAIQRKVSLKKGGIFAEKMLAAEFFLSAGEMLHTLDEIANLD